MSTRTILVIDDDIDLVKVIRVALENEGFRVLDAQTGQRGLVVVKDEEVDLIILDVMMADLDEGFHVAYQLRQDRRTADIPLLMLSAVGDRTGFAFDPDRDADFLPVDEFLEKPVSPRVLIDLVRKHLPTKI